MKRVKIRETGPLSLEMTFPHSRRKTERLAITDPFYPRTKLAIELFRSLGTMELVAPYLPEIIDTDFAVHAEIARLIEEMYRSCGKPSGPCFTEPLNKQVWDIAKENIIWGNALVSHSSGKDSLHSVMCAQELWGAERVMPVHISGLNTSNAKGEREYAFRQREELGWPHFRTVELMSSAKCTRNGYEVMRSRDFFMTGLLVPVALEFGAGSIWTEGFAEALESEPFTGIEANMKRFNRILKRMVIPIEIVWKNLREMEVIRQVYQKRPGWMEHVHNCFTLAYRKGSLRRSWERRTPSWPLYDSQCGSCSKCRITRLGQLMYDREGLVGVTAQDVRTFLKDTAQYALTQWRDWYLGRDNHRDMLVESFLRDLDHKLVRYGLVRERDRMFSGIERYENLVREKQDKKRRRVA